MATTRLSRTAGTPTLNTKHTISMWLKRSKLSYGDCFLIDGYQDGNNRFKLSFDASDRLECYNTHGGSYKYNVVTNRKFRDVSAFYHLVVRIDTTQASASNRVRIYVNGTEEESFSTYTDATQDDANNVVNESGATISIGDYQGGSNAFEGIMSHVHFVDGTSYAASTFGSTDSTTGEWQINTSPSITMGNNGFTILKDGNTITDQSSNSNNFTLSSGTLTKTEDCPSNVFATLNSLVNTPADTGSLSNGSNTYTTSNYSYNTRSTLGMTSGKFYWEQKVNNATAVKVGLCTSQYDPSLDTDSSTAHYGGAGGGGVYVLMSNSTTTWQSTFSDTSKATGSYTNAIASTSSSILMGAVDVDANKLWVGVDGVWMNSGNPATGANAQITFTNSSPDALHIMASHGDNASRATSWNFGNGYFGTTAVASAGTNASGNGIFEYDVPANFTALSTKGLNL